MIRVVGYRDRTPRGAAVVETTSRSKQDWSKGLSPFFLGPVALYGGYVAQNVENAWQYAKVYPRFISNNQVLPSYMEWALKGWAQSWADRYPEGKGAIPAFSYWDGKKLDYIEARKRIYVPLYAAAVVKSEAFRKLKALHEKVGEVWLLDFDGYDHVALGMTLEQVLNDPTRKMGHAFVLAGLLEGNPLFHA